MIHRVEISRKPKSWISSRCVVNGKTFECVIDNNYGKIEYRTIVEMKGSQVYFNKVRVGEVSFRRILKTTLKVETDNGVLKLEKMFMHSRGTIDGFFHGKYLDGGTCCDWRHIGFCREENEVPFVIAVLMGMYKISLSD